MLSPLAGTLPTADALVDVDALLDAYHTRTPDAENPAHRVSFGTSGHRGSSLTYSFNEAHILAVTQAVCEVRAQNGVTGPMFVGMDTHALSRPVMQTTLEVLAANGVTVYVDDCSDFTPTPVISHAILCYNRKGGAQADGIVITPSHNPPKDGGFKYNPPTGGPADSDLTGRIEKRANALLASKNVEVRRITAAAVKSSGLVQRVPMLDAYVADLGNVLNMPVISAAGLRLGADPLGGATLDLWDRVAERYGLNIDVVNRALDPTFRFVPLDHDGQTRMDCSSPFAMGGLLAIKDKYDLGFACDPDSDRHGIVTSTGLLNPNHYLSVAAWHLFQNRPGWPTAAGIGKTVVTSSMLNRVGAALGRAVCEVPVGFKWFVPYLFDGTCGMGCEESAGASFLRFDGTPWTTDKDGPLLCLLAAEIFATAKVSPSEVYAGLTTRFGAPAYSRVDSPLDPSRRARFAALTAASLPSAMLAGDPITAVITCAPGNSAPIGGIKVSSDEGWFAVRPSGTEPICKVYTESFSGEAHRKRLELDAVAMLGQMLH